MRSVSFDAKTVNKLFKKELKHEDFQLFTNNQLAYKDMWKQQNHEFWIKFVTSLRNEIYDSQFYKPDLSDAIFVELLKKLVSKSFDSLVKQIESAGQKLAHKPQKAIYDSSESEDEDSKCKTHINPKYKLPQDQFEQRLFIESHCAAAFVKLHSLWKNAPEGTQIEWKEPDTWSSFSYVAKPYEEYLKSRWGKGLLNKIGRLEEQIGWWENKAVPVKVCAPPAQKSAAHKSSSPAQESPAPQSANRTVSDASPKPYVSYKPASKKTTNKKKKNSYREERRDEKKIFCRERNQEWLPAKYSRMKYINLPPTSEIKNYNFYKTLDTRDDGFDFKWFSLEELFPPVLSNRFHTMNPASLYEAKSDMHHLATCTWFPAWSVAFGEHTMGFLQIQIKELDNVDVVAQFPYFVPKHLALQGWTSEMESLVVALVEAKRAHWSRPGASEIASTASEFLLEPCVLIQLPWHIVLLQQWLGVALIEIMKFEKETMELRHWPLVPGDTEMCTRELLWLISRAKQRVLLGLYLLVSQVQMNINPSRMIPALLMDSVVLPTVPVLKFLCSDQALVLLNDLKYAAFAQPYNIQEAFTIPESVYLVHKDLQDFYVNHHWHAQFWLNDENLSPFPYMDGNMNLKQILQALKAEIPSPPKSKLAKTCKISKEEATVHDLWTSLNFENKVLADVLKSISNPRRLIKILSKLGYFEASDEDRLCYLILENECNRPYLEDFVQRSELFALTTFPLNGIERHDTVMSWLVRLSGEVLEKEQLARLAAICALLLDKSPRICGLKQMQATNTPLRMLEKVRQVQSQVHNTNRNWLWNQLPQAWRQPVTNFEHVPDVSEGLETIAYNLAIRVGKIISGVAVHSFQNHDNGLEEFKRWQTVQYTVPGYITTLLEVAHTVNTPQNEPRIKNLVLMLHTMVQFYEKMYLDWLKDAPRKKTRDLVPYFRKGNDYDEDEKKAFIVASGQGRIWHERVSQLMYAYVGLGNELEGVPGFEAWLDGIMWVIVSTPSAGWNGTNTILTTTWVNHNLPCFDDLLKICKLAWNVPEPGSKLGSGPMLTKIYLASTALEEMRAIMTLQGAYQPNLALTVHHQNLADGSFNPEEDWKYTLMSLVVQAQGQLPMEKEVTMEKIEMFASDGQNILLQLWSALANLRRRMNSWKGAVINMPSDYDHLTHVRSLINLFKLGHVSAIEAKLAIVPYTGKGAVVIRHEMRPLVSPSAARSFKHEPTVVAELKNVANEMRNLDVAFKNTAKRCRRCHKVEEVPGSFLLCSECEKQQYPDPNFFCTLPCLDVWWKEEHLAEHLEYELGLSDLCAPNQ